MKQWEEKIKIFSEYIEICWVKWSRKNLEPEKKKDLKNKCIQKNWNWYFKLSYAKKIAKQKNERMPTEEDMKKIRNHWFYQKVPPYIMFDLLWIESLWYCDNDMSLVIDNTGLLVPLYYNLQWNYWNFQKRMFYAGRIKHKNKSFTPIRTIKL